MNIDFVIRILRKEVVKYKVPIMDLVKNQTHDPFKILVGTILSARTKDEVTAVVLPKLWKEVGRADDFRKLSVEQIQKLIYPVGFYKNKAKFLKKLPEVLDKEFGGKLPQSVEELVKLPGVGRKTANLVVALAFDKPAICVDTHVHKIMNGLGYVKTKNPLETEMALRKKLPKKYWIDVNRLLVAFGQHLCRPVSPKCSICPIYKYCSRIGVTNSR
tara:strand:- start:2166 stop:2813 length:648 start_codon:yes stop_codon:yes gene_type:complete